LLALREVIRFTNDNAHCVDREFKDSGHYGFTPTPLLDNYLYKMVYTVVLFISVQYILPTIALVYLNTSVIIALRRSDTYRLTTAPRRYPSSLASPVTSHPVHVGVTSSSTRSITVVVAVIVSICIVVHVVALTAHVINTVRVSITYHQTLRLLLFIPYVLLLCYFVCSFSFISHLYLVYYFYYLRQISLVKGGDNVFT